MKDTSTAIEKGEVKFLTPVVFFTTPELGGKGLVIVDLEQLREAQKNHEKELSQIKKDTLQKVRESLPEKDKQIENYWSESTTKQLYAEGYLNAMTPS